MSIFIISLTAFNVLLWIIFLIRFKRLFSTDKVVEKTADKINKMIKNIDEATERDLYLSGEAEKRINQSIEETQKKIELFKEASQRLKDMIAEADRINKISNQSSSLFQDFNKINNKSAIKNVNEYLKNKPKSQPKVEISADSAYELTASNQPDLFSEDNSSSKNAWKDETILTADGAAYKEVPLVITKVYDDEYVTSDEHPKPQLENAKRNLTKKIRQLLEQDYTVEQIASELSCSETEVEMIIDMEINN